MPSTTRGPTTMVRQPITTRPSARRMRSLVWLVCLGWVSLGAPPSQPLTLARAGQTASTGVPDRVRIRLELVGTPYDQPTGRPRVEAFGTLAAGERLTRFMTAGGPDDPDVCHVGAMSDAASAQGVYVWKLDVEAVAVSPTQTTLQVQWSRTRGAWSTQPAEAGDTRTLTLGPGDYQILDYVSAAPAVSSCASLVLRVLAEPLPPPSAQRPLTVDLWLTQEGTAGPEWVHEHIDGRSGQPLPFRLGPLRWSVVNEGTPGAGSEPVLGLEVRGTLVVEVRPDGLLDATVRLTRTFTSGRGGVEGEGSQDFRCALGEAVALILPDPRGQIRLRRTSRAGASFVEGVTADDKTTVIDLARFFAGREGTLYVVVHEAR
jgi:hypothetical protein